MCGGLCASHAISDDDNRGARTNFFLGKPTFFFFFLNRNLNGTMLFVPVFYGGHKNFWRNFPLEHFCLLLRKPKLDRFYILLDCQITVRPGACLAYLFRRLCDNYGAFLKPGTYFIEQTRYLVCPSSQKEQNLVEFALIFIDFGREYWYITSKIKWD